MHVPAYAVTNFRIRRIFPLRRIGVRRQGGYDAHPSFHKLWYDFRPTGTLVRTDAVQIEIQIYDKAEKREKFARFLARRSPVSHSPTGS